MKRLTILFLLIFTSIAHAQEDTAPWTPDPSEIFAEGVEVVDVVVREYTATNTIPQLDNEARVVRVYDSSMNILKEFPYPEEVEEFQYIRSWGANSLLMHQEFAASGDPDPNGAYIIDIQIGTPTPAQNNCGVVPPLDDENRWIFFTDTRIGRTALCETYSGEVTALLPQDFMPSLNSSERPLEVSESPNGNYLAFIGIDSRTSSGNITGYAYNYETHELLRLGDFAWEEQVRIGGWATDEYVTFITRRMPEWSVCHVYYANTGVENSLQLGLSQMRFCPTLAEDAPPRLVTTADGMTGDSQGPIYCARTEFNLITAETIVTDYDGLCWPDYTRQNGISYHRRVNDPEQDAAELVRLNPLTREQITLYEGEIEWVLWVSEDEKYAELVLDVNGRIDFYPGGDPQWWYLPDGGKLALVDLTTDEILYQINAGWVSDGFSGSPTSFLQRISETELFALEAISTGRGYTYRAVSITLDPNGITEQVLADHIIYTVPFLGDRYLMWTDDYTEAGLVTLSGDNTEITAPVSLYNREANASTPIIASIDTQQYQLVIGRAIDADRLNFILRPRIMRDGYLIVDQTRSITYTIRLP